MKKSLLVLLLVMSVRMVTRGEENVSLPKWFLNPAEHNYVGISEPDGDVQWAINVALFHYLIYQDFPGKLNRSYIMNISGEEQISNSKTYLTLDTTLQYSIEEIVSTPKGEYICRISDKPSLSRRIVLYYASEYDSEKSAEIDSSLIKYEVKCLFEDANGVGKMIILYELHSDNKGNDTFEYKALYQDVSGRQLGVVEDSDSKVLGEQLILAYLQHLENGFEIVNLEGDPLSSSINDAYHKATPFSGFKYEDGYLIIQN